MKILIGGDSWGCGEWGHIDGKYCVTHKGLEQYFLDDGHDVTNVSIPGASNIDSTYKFVNESIDDGYNYRFWFQSDPIRDLSPYINFNNNIRGYDDLVRQYNIQLSITYHFLHKSNTMIYLIGGCSKLNLDILKKRCDFNKNLNYNLIPVIDSMTEFLIEGYKHPDIWCSDWINSIDDTFEDMDLLLEQKRIQDSLIDNRQYFFPDMGHPNRDGHKMLFEYIKVKYNIRDTTYFYP